MNKAKIAGDVRIRIDHIHWYVPQYTPSSPQQGFLSKQIINRTDTELRFIERFVFLKEVNNQHLWNSGLGSQERMNIPIWINIGFQRRG